MITDRFRRFVAWLHRKISRNQFDDVREFVYLDEISVRSLLASTGEGAITTETVEQNVQTTRWHRSASAGVPVGSAEIGGQAGTERETQTSVEERRNYNLTQSKFTRLHNSDAVNTKLSLGQLSDENPPFDGLLVDDLNRGDVIELRVNISANLLFRLYQTFDYLGEAAEQELDREAEKNLRLTELSLGNMIPIIGAAIDYHVVETDGEKIIKRSSNTSEESIDELDLEITTLLDIENLWADPIHTLFNEDEFGACLEVRNRGF